MRNYQVDLYRQADGWTAVVADLLIVGQGETAEAATADAIDRAEEAENRLTGPGLAARDKNNVLKIRYDRRQAVAARVVDILLEYGLRAVILLILLGVIYTAVRADLRDNVAAIRDDIAAIGQWISSNDNAVETNGNDVMAQRARALNNKLLPTARELRPLIDALIGDTPSEPTPEK